MFAFSVENFKRSPGEVSVLMWLAETKLEELLQVRSKCIRSLFLDLACLAQTAIQRKAKQVQGLGFIDKLQEHQIVDKFSVQVRVIGDLALLPPAVQSRAQKVMEATAGNEKAILNICLAYT